MQPNFTGDVQSVPQRGMRGKFFFRIKHTLNIMPLCLCCNPSIIISKDGQILILLEAIIFLWYLSLTSWSVKKSFDCQNWSNFCSFFSVYNVNRIANVNVLSSLHEPTPKQFLPAIWILQQAPSCMLDELHKQPRRFGGRCSAGTLDVDGIVLVFPILFFEVLCKYIIPWSQKQQLICT